VFYFLNRQSLSAYSHISVKSIGAIVFQTLQYKAHLQQ